MSITDIGYLSTDHTATDFFSAIKLSARSLVNVSSCQLSTYQPNNYQHVVLSINDIPARELLAYHLITSSIFVLQELNTLIVKKKKFCVKTSTQSSSEFRSGSCRRRSRFGSHWAFRLALRAGSTCRRRSHVGACVHRTDTKWVAVLRYSSVDSRSVGCACYKWTALRFEVVESWWIYRRALLSVVSVDMHTHVVRCTREVV